MSGAEFPQGQLTHSEINWVIYLVSNKSKDLYQPLLLKQRYINRYL